MATQKSSPPHSWKNHLQKEALAKLGIDQVALPGSSSRTASSEVDGCLSYYTKSQHEAQVETQSLNAEQILKLRDLGQSAH